MRSNLAAVNLERTHEGGLARTPKPSKQLERQVATCLLFENTFYESGSMIAREIAATCRSVPPEEIAAVAIKARTEFHLRHVPLFLLAQLDLRRAECPGLVARTVAEVIRRPDEMAELLSVVAKVNPGKPLKKALSAQIKKGLAAAFVKFSAYQLAKWNRPNAINLRDVLFLCHAKPKDAEQAETWKKLIAGTLETPDTWEVALSSGADKRATWERLLAEGALGYTALLMNLRNMVEAGVPQAAVESAIVAGAASAKVLPFKFFAAAKAAPAYSQSLSDAMVAALAGAEKLHGQTILLIDVSGSMDDPLSRNGQLTRMEAASALAVLLREVCSTVRVFTFSNHLVEVANLRGLALASSIVGSQPHSGTQLSAAVRGLLLGVGAIDRLVVVTDEQSQDGIVHLPCATKGYLLNVAPYSPALEVSGGWSRISGFSERVVDFIRYAEAR